MTEEQKPSYEGGAVLLPCPFCGSTSVEVLPKNPESEGNAWGAVQCVNFDCPTYDGVRSHGVRIWDGEDVSDERGSDAYKRAAIARWNRRAHPPALGEWRDIGTAPKDGTVFLGCNLDHPSFGSWPMYRRVRHYCDDHGRMQTDDLGGWAKICDLEPDYDDGHDTGPCPVAANAPDNLNKSVRYGWMPLPLPPVSKE